MILSKALKAAGIACFLIGIYFWIDAEALIFYGCYWSTISNSPVIIDFWFSLSIFWPIILFDAVTGLLLVYAGIKLINKKVI
ncbi:MAG: hypothetical protein PHW36_00710 [Bacilli bacterium]|nr:hypothetical protein [Bacilli bacterium]